MTELGLRSILFVPGTQPERFAKALDAGADAVCLDLEDSVPPFQKDRAREQIRTYLSLSGAGLRTVRINSLSSRDGLRDLLALVENGERCGAVLIPKVESASVLDLAARVLAPHAVPIIALIETVAGLRAADAIARATDVALIVFGSADYAAQVGCEMSPTGLAQPRARIAEAAALAGIACMDGAWLRLDDPEGLTADCVLAGEMGFSGKPAIHPRQVDTINAAFTPSRSAVARANAILSATQADAHGVSVIDGLMVDAALVPGARRVLALAAGAARRERES